MLRDFWYNTFLSVPGFTRLVEFIRFGQKLINLSDIFDYLTQTCHG